jgi:diguanylate cyclase (GGDEF)-like protein/PAS domain S-box-containing protein
MTPPDQPSIGRPLPEQLAHLRLLERAAAAANQCGTLEDAAALVLREVCDYTGWPVGHLYVAEDVQGVSRLVPTTTWHLDDAGRFTALRSVIESMPLEPGVGLPGRIWTTRRPAWIADVLADGNFLRAHAGTELGVRAAFGFPVVVGGEAAGVLEFFAEEPAPRDDALMELMSTVGHQLARVVERERATRALRTSEERYRALAESAQDGIVTTDQEGRIVSFNRAAERIFGHAEDEVVGHPLTVLMPAGFQEAYRTAVARLGGVDAPQRPGRTVELEGVRRDGTEFPIEVSLSTWEASGVRFYTCIVRDTTDRRLAERDREAFARQLAQRTLHDPLTGLPNRALLRDRLEHAAARAARKGTGLAVLSVDLDRFKDVNETYGHQAGDQVLVAVAGRLRDALRPDDTVARIGGDQFALLCEEITDRAEAQRFAERLTTALSASYVVDGREVAVSASVGVATGGVGVDSEQLLRDAEVAREQARQRGHGQAALYEESMRAQVEERLAVERELRSALREGELCLYYQPIVDIGTGLVAGVEALVRWQHPARGLLAPQDFITVAEETGLIVPLGRWVLEEACRQGALWQRGPGTPEHLRVSVNVSARQFQQPRWADEVAHALLTSGFPASQLVLEITESVLMKDTSTTSERLSELRELGVGVAIDDFGTGYSSLGYLRRFPVDILKVDKSFIDGVAEGPHESALARAVIKLAATLHLDAVAEGVSTRKQLATLRRLRCRYAQGYYFARPQPASAIADLLARPSVEEEGPGNGAGAGVLERRA